MNEQELNEKLDEIKKIYIKEISKKFDEEIEKIKKENIQDREIIKESEKFYFLNSCNNLISDYFENESKYHLYLLYNNNVWSSTEECKKYSDIDYKFKKLVYELNLKEPIDWKNKSQFKYLIYFDFDKECLSSGLLVHCKMNGVIYCTDENILDKAIELIGKDDFEWYIKVK
jgi:hypothetical protein